MCSELKRINRDGDMYETDDNEFPFEDDALEPSPACLALFCYEMRCSVERAMFKSRLPSVFFEHFP